MYEAVLYVLAETLAWYTSVYEYPKASKWFYYANRSEVEESREKSIRSVNSEVGELESDDDNGGLKTIEI